MNPRFSYAFENEGNFYAGHVKHRTPDGKVIKRRCLCFALRNAVVGASVNFSRAEAYHTARRAASGTLPLPVTQPTIGATLAAVLKSRGFPIPNVRDPSVEVDDTTAMSLGREFAAT